MGLERGNRYMHPLGKRQSVEQTIELVFAVGAVQAEDPGLAGSGAQSPNPDEMPLVHQLGCSGCFRVLTALDLGIRSSVGNIHIELDQEFHGVLRSAERECERLRTAIDLEQDDR